MVRTLASFLVTAQFYSKNVVYPVSMTICKQNPSAKKCASGCEFEKIIRCVLSQSLVSLYFSSLFPSKTIVSLALEIVKCLRNLPCDSDK